MKLFLITALVAVCGAAKLDRAYLPPDSAKTAGGSPGSIQTPFAANSFNQGSGFPKGSFSNEFEGVVVDAATAGTRASEGESGLGAPRISYGSTNSKVGNAAFGEVAGFRQGNQGSVDSAVQAANNRVSGAGVHHGSSESHFAAGPERSQAPYDRVANTLRYENEVNPDSYNFAFETDNGISAEENGVAVDGIHAQGGYSYTGDDGQVYSITYTADEGGYQPRGDHLPTPPPIPEEILKSLEQNARDEAAGVIDDGSYDAAKYNAGADYTETDVTRVEQSDRQAPSFGNQHESDASISGTFINQNNQAFVRPNTNAIHGQEDAPNSQDSATNAFRQPGSTNAFSQVSQSNRFSSNGLGSRNEYNHPNTNNAVARPQKADTQYNAAFNGNQPEFSQVTLSSSTFSRPGTNRGQVAGQHFNQKPSVASSNTQQSHVAGSLVSQNEFSSAGQHMNGNSPFSSQNFNQQSQSSASFQSPKLPMIFSQVQKTQRPQTFNNPISHKTNRFSVTGERVESSRPSNTFISQRPTSQPSIELTTPFESNVQSNTDVDSSFSLGVDSLSTNTRLTSQQGSQTIRQPTFRPSNPTSPSFAHQTPSAQNQFHSDEDEYVHTHNQQQQGPDNSYYYKQPAKPFNAPSTLESRFQSPSPGQLNRIAQQAQASPRYSGPSQAFPAHSGQSQRHPVRGSTTRYPQPPTFPSIAPTSSSSAQFQTTISSQYNGNTVASSSPFGPQRQGSTRYPRPPSFAPTVPTNPIGFPSRNGITQATATAFASSAPTFSENVNSHSSAPMPAFQASQANFQSMQSFVSKPHAQVSQDKDVNNAPSVSTQQYSGEIYEYNKPAERLPAPAKSESSKQDMEPRPHFESHSNRKQQQPRPTESRPSFGAQYSSQAAVNTEDQPAQDSKPQFNIQPRPFEAQPQGIQTRPQNANCCQSLDSQIAQLESESLTQGNNRPNAGFGTRFSGSGSSSHSFTGEMETFSGPRNPTTFDQETGYHY